MALGEIRSGFSPAGAPPNDLWIAALALEHGLVLYTRDAHFEKVPGLARL